jgi:hypothetical protein
MNDLPNDPPYTGPTGSRMENGLLHIDGYPTAERLAEMPAPLGKRIADLRLHQSDLVFCEEAMQELAKVVPAVGTVARALLIAVLTKFFSCFGRNEASEPLQPGRIFKGEAGAMEVFNYFKALRNKHIVHNESVMTYTRTAVVLGHGSAIQDIMSLQFFPELMDEAHPQQLYELVAYTLKAVAKEIEDARAAGFAKLRAMTAEQRAALPDLPPYIAPTAADAWRVRSS